jgi:hypothetical protein
MTTTPRFRIEEEPTYGVVIRCIDVEVADRFEDFLSERKYVLFNVKFEGPEVLFFFGQASSIDRVQKLLSQFEGEEGLGD